MLVKTEAEALDAFAYLGAYDDIVVDVEATGVNWRKDRVFSIQLLAGDRAFYFPFRHEGGGNLPISYLHHIYAEVLPPERLQIGFHYTFDMKIGAKDGAQLPRVIRDPLFAAHQMNENEATFRLKDLAVIYLGDGEDESERLLIETLEKRFGGRGRQSKGNMWRLTPEEVYQYGVDDLFLTRRMLDFYTPILHEWSIWDLFVEVNDFAIALAEMELRGVPVNSDKLRAIGAKAAPEAARLRELIGERAREDLDDPTFPANPNSHPQMRMWLKKALGIGDTTHDTLAAEDDERARLLLDYRKWHKLNSSFVEPYLNGHIIDGRIHTNLYITTPGIRDRGEVHGTVSDRVSSTEPNAQQVPDVVREAMDAPPGFTMVEADFSQAELRLAAHYYETLFKDYSLGDILRAGEDMHKAAADDFGIPRKEAKRRNFMIQYGGGARRLATKFGTHQRDEQRYLNFYNKKFPGAPKLRKYMERVAEKKGYIRLWNKRTRRFNTAKAASYKASNNLIQGGIAQMVRAVIVRLRREVPEALMILTVHDSVLFLIPNDKLHVIDRIRVIMQDQPWCTLPMIVDIKTGQAWGTLEPLPRKTDGIPAHALVGVNLSANGFA